MKRLTESAQNDNDDRIGEIAAAIARAVATQRKSCFAEREVAALEVSNEAIRCKQNCNALRTPKMKSCITTCIATGGISLAR
jgi:hypothetical protein